MTEQTACHKDIEVMRGNALSNSSRWCHFHLFFRISLRTLHDISSLRHLIGTAGLRASMGVGKCAADSYAAASNNARVNAGRVVKV